MKTFPKRDYYTFILEAARPSTLSDARTGVAKRYPVSFSIPATVSIVEKKGNRDNPDYQEETIRYVRGAKSIYVDEQPEDVGSRRITKPKFIDGQLIVKATEKNLLDFLRKHPNNRDSETALEDNTPKLFYEHNPEAEAEKLNVSRTNRFKAMKLAYDLDFKTKVVPICNFVGIETARRSQDLINFDFFAWVENNIESFLSIAEDDLVIDRSLDVKQAQDAGIISVKGNTWYWEDKGMELVSFSLNSNPYEALVEWTYEGGIEQWKTINKQLAQRFQGEKQEASGNPELERLLGLSAEDLFEEAKEVKVIEWKTPNFVFGKTKIAKSKEDLLKKLNSIDTTLKNDIAFQVFKATQGE